MTITPTVSLRLSLATQERLRQARRPGESQDALIRRALDALAAPQTAKDGPAVSDPCVGIAEAVSASEARLEARMAMMLKDALASLAPSPPGAVHLQHSAGQPSAPGVLHLSPSATQGPAPSAGHLQHSATQAYPLEVKREALAMQDAGHPNRVIAAFILERTGRKPDSKNMGALLKNWRKALGDL